MLGGRPMALLEAAPGSLGPVVCPQPGGVEGVQRRSAPCRVSQRISLLTFTQGAVRAAHGALPAEVGMPNADGQSAFNSMDIWLCFLAYEHTLDTPIWNDPHDGCQDID